MRIDYVEQAEAEVVPSSSLVEVEIEVGVEVELGVEVGLGEVKVGHTFSIVSYFFGWVGGVWWGSSVLEVRDKAISTQVVVEVEV